MIRGGHIGTWSVAGTGGKEGDQGRIRGERIVIRGGHRGTRNGIWGRHSKDKEGGSGVDSGGKGIRGGHRGTIGEGSVAGTRFGTKRD